MEPCNCYHVTEAALSHWKTDLSYVYFA